MVHDHPIDDPRPIKVICIGAGISGIITGVRFPQNIKNLDLVIYEKNTDVGGTWLENKFVKQVTHYCQAELMAYLVIRGFAVIFPVRGTSSLLRTTRNGASFTRPATKFKNT